MENKKSACDVCGSLEDVRCEIFTNDDGNIDRVYHMCPSCLITLYRNCIESFMEGSEHKINSYVKIYADRMIMDSITSLKVDISLSDVEDIESVDLCKVFNPECVRVVKTSSFEECI